MDEEEININNKLLPKLEESKISLVNKSKYYLIIVFCILLISSSFYFFIDVNIKNKNLQIEKRELILAKEKEDEEVKKQKTEEEKQKLKEQEEKQKRKTLYEDTKNFPQANPNAHNEIAKVYETKEKIAYLTFDDGPSSDITPHLLDLLKQENIKATFFVTGNSVMKNRRNFKKSF